MRAPSGKLRAGTLLRGPRRRSAPLDPPPPGCGRGAGGPILRAGGTRFTGICIAGDLFPAAKRLTTFSCDPGQPRWNAAACAAVAQPAYAAVRRQPHPGGPPPRKSARSGRPGDARPRPQRLDRVGVPAIVLEETFCPCAGQAGHQPSEGRAHPPPPHLLPGCPAVVAAVVHSARPGRLRDPCRGRTDALRVALGQRCNSRTTPAVQRTSWLCDLGALLADPPSRWRWSGRERAWCPTIYKPASDPPPCPSASWTPTQRRGAYLARCSGSPSSPQSSELDRRRPTAGQQRHLTPSPIAPGLRRRRLIQAFCHPSVRAGHRDFDATASVELPSTSGRDRRRVESATFCKSPDGPLRPIASSERPSRSQRLPRPGPRPHFNRAA